MSKPAPRNRRAFFGALAIALAFCAPAAQAQFPDMFYYKFDEGAGTTTANLANPGSVPGTPGTILGAHAMGPAGQFNGGLTGSGGSGASDYVDTGWVTNLGASSWTLSFWVDLSTVAAVNPFGYVFGDITASSWRCFANGAAGVGNFVLRGAHADVIITGGADQITGHTLTFVHDSTTQTIKGYRDGILVNTVAVGALNIVGTANLKFAGYSSSGGLPAGTLFDEFRMYSYALTDAEVMATANVELFDRNILEISQTGPGVGDLTVSLSALSATGLEGWTFMSGMVALPEGSGPLLGITPDATSWYSLTVPYAPGNPFHFNAADIGVFPQVPFSAPPGALNGLAGQTFDFVTLMLNASGSYDSKSNVFRYTFQ